MDSKDLLEITREEHQKQKRGSIKKTHLRASLNFQGINNFEEAAYHIEEVGYQELSVECKKLASNN